MNRRYLLKAATGMFAVSVANGLHAQQGPWPNRPIRMIVPHAAGTSPDVVARILGEKLGQVLGQAIVIDNRVGAGGLLGAEAAAASAADGYNLLFTVKGVLAIGPHLHTAARFNAARDFKAVTEILQVPHIITATPGTPYNTLRELADYARANPGKIDYGSAGIGSQPHVALATLASRLGIRMNHIPYKGSPTADVMSGVVSLYLEAATTAVPMIKAGKLKGIAVSGNERLPALPDLATITETGANLDPNGVVGNSWHGVFVPAAVSQEIVTRLNTEIVKIIAMPELQTRLRSLGLTPTGTPAATLTAELASDYAYWAQLVREVGVKAE
jgi:tripartite-type tricarboxylate transporter receptor subunit TctC